MMKSVKLATLDFLKVKIKMFWNKGYDVITFAHDIANKLLSRDSNHFVDLVI